MAMWEVIVDRDIAILIAKLVQAGRRAHRQDVQMRKLR